MDYQTEQSYPPLQLVMVRLLLVPEELFKGNNLFFSQLG